MPDPGDPLDQLVRQIIAKWVSLAATTFTGIRGPYRNEAPSGGTSHPYAILRDAGGGADLIHTTCESETYEALIEFRIYDKSPELTSVHIAKVDGVFSSQSLSLTQNGVTVTGVRLVRPAYQQADEGVWFAGLTYRFQFSRARIA